MRPTHIVCSIFIAMLFINCQRLPQQPFVAVNLLGYNIGNSEQVLLINADPTGFEIINPLTSELIYEGSITKPLSPDPSIGDRASLIDFSDFGSKGYFTIQGKEVPDILVGEFNNQVHLRGQELTEFPVKNYEDNEK